MIVATREGQAAAVEAEIQKLEVCVCVSTTAQTTTP